MDAVCPFVISYLSTIAGNNSYAFGCVEGAASANGNYYIGIVF